MQDQHGFARDYVLERVEESPASVTHRLVSNAETRKVYPFDFELHINYKLNKKELTVEWQVKNCGDETMYFTIGGHPAFRFAKPEETKADYVLKGSGKREAGVNRKGFTLAELLIVVAILRYWWLLQYLFSEVSWKKAGKQQTLQMYALLMQKC